MSLSLYNPYQRKAPAGVNQVARARSEQRNCFRLRQLVQLHVSEDLHASRARADSWSWAGLRETAPGFISDFY